jgi:hypothetical protein
MPKMVDAAASKALIQYQINGDISPFVVVDGIQFRAPIRIKNGQAYVPTVFPVGVVK